MVDSAEASVAMALGQGFDETSERNRSA
ncbi:hypothetical protein LCGC14_2822390, partial [marine sediment metagenome]